MNDIDPKDAATIVSVIAEDLPRPAAATARQRVVVRLRKELKRDRRQIPAGIRIRPQLVTGGARRSLLVDEYVIYAATFQNYDARRIVGELNAKYESQAIVRISSVRALMHSVRLPDVHEAKEFEE